MYCTNCGKEIKDGAKFCPFCGTPMELPEIESGKEKSDAVVSANFEIVPPQPESAAPAELHPAQFAAPEKPNNSEEKNQEIAAVQVLEPMEEEPKTTKKKRKGLIAGIIIVCCAAGLAAAFALMPQTPKKEKAVPRYVIAKDNNISILTGLKEKAEKIPLGSYNVCEGNDEAPPNNVSSTSVKFSKDGKYVYFLAPREDGSSQLNRVDATQLKTGEEKNNFPAETIDGDVDTENWDVLDDESLIYLSDIHQETMQSNDSEDEAGEDSSGDVSAYGVEKLSYYNGENTVVLDKNVSTDMGYRLSEKKDVVVYVSFKDEKWNLYYCKLDEKCEPELIASNLNQPLIYCKDKDFSNIVYPKKTGHLCSATTSECYDDEKLTPKTETVSLFDIWEGGVDRESEKIASDASQIINFESADNFYFATTQAQQKQLLDYVKQDIGKNDENLEAPEYDDYRIDDPDDFWGYSYDTDAYGAAETAYEAALRRINLREELSNAPFSVWTETIYHHTADGNSKVCSDVARGSGNAAVNVNMVCCRKSVVLPQVPLSSIESPKDVLDAIQNAEDKSADITYFFHENVPVMQLNAHIRQFTASQNKKYVMVGAYEDNDNGSKLLRYDITDCFR